MERLYLDIDGNKHPKAHVNKHHTFQRHSVKGMGGIFRRFIDQHGLYLPMMVTEHRELHARVEPPPVPSLTLIHRVNGFMNELEPQNPYERFIAVTDYFATIAETTGNTSHREQSERIADNLQRQAKFILLGQVTIVPLQEAA